MPALIRSSCIVVLSGYFTVLSAQLPPEILVDKYLIHAEQLHAATDFAAAFDVMQEIIALQKEHGLAVPDDFHFKFALVALSADSMQIALDSVTRYLSATGKEGQHYREALKVMLKAEGNEVLSPEEFYNDVIKAQGTCEGLPRGSSCWMPLTNNPDCYVWNGHLTPGESVIWNGTCSGHVAEGEGTLTWYQIRQENGRQTKQKGSESTGRLKNGKKEGKWVRQDTTYKSDGSIYDFGVAKRHYVNGQRHGPSIYFGKQSYYKGTGDEDPFLIRIYHNLRGKSAYDWYEWIDASDSLEDDGIDQYGNGRLVFRSTNGRTWGGPLVNSKKHGEWIERVWDRPESRGRYVDGNRHGKWVFRYADGIVLEGPYVEGKRDGQWVGRNMHGDMVLGGTYVDFIKSGKWMERLGGFKLGQFRSFGERYIGEGPYVDGSKHGQWIYRHPNGDFFKVDFVDGDRQLPIFWYDYDEGKCWRMTEEKRKKVNKKNCLR